MVGIEIAQSVRKTSTDSASAVKVKQVVRRGQPARAYIVYIAGLYSYIAYIAPKGSHHARLPLPEGKCCPSTV